MKYVLIICGAEVDLLDSVGRPKASGCEGWNDELKAKGMLHSEAGLRPPSEATTVRVRGDDVLVVDGPFAETRDQIGGFTLIECADLDEAIEVAAKHPVAKQGSIEIRPLWE
ncbi:MAG: transcription initiation protein [Actinophytocola sp.]|uniref:YciI family protein n=1 Tax=Actinophytocola sp. TaxID=1872138 RepID=UPI00132616EC|nr:YciI family protein [Actinophytocola sp.]MPZ85183.1 transcription initiation protein [Actinophytocola sp.]